MVTKMAKIVQKTDSISYHRSRCGHAEMNEATARQDGNRNESTQTQRFDKNTALVNQDGNVNVAVQDQRTLTNMAKGSEAIIRQNGNFNKAEQMQKERTTMRKPQDGNHNSAWTTQTGDKNSAITSRW
jgi:hypothetical protein